MTAFGLAALGRLLILLSLLTAATGATIGFAAGARQSVTGAAWTRRFAYLFSALIVLANLVMVYALLTHDFSVSYVASVGSRAVPTWVTIVSLWSSLEGSILFWGAILGAYVAVATFLYRNRYQEYMSYAIATWLGCGTFFAFLIAGPANPFGTVAMPPLDGPGPNPLLQNHVLMVIHPPFLYLGYVGMTIPFGLACAALLTGRLGHDFLRPLRTWLLLPWTFLTVAIMFGGWWAYEVLGWGGYWAWDPVENASLLPWLTATAAIHSAIVMDRKGILKGWTVTLVQGTFLLTILGTFMTRSGVFNSVHSFTQSSIGPTILAFLAVTLFYCVATLAMRIDKLEAESSIESGSSREGMFLVNNLLFVLFTFTVLIGTAFPLIVEAMRGLKMSVGRPYFDTMAIPIGAALLFLMGVGPALPWGRANAAQLKKSLLPPLGLAAVLTALGLIFGVRSPWTLLTLAFGGFTLHITMREMWLPMIQRMRVHREGLAEAFVQAQIRRGRRRFGAYIVHAAVIVVIVSIAVSSTTKVTKEVQMKAGEQATIGPYTLTFTGVRQLEKPHRTEIIADMIVSKNGKQVAVMGPRMNQYAMMREPIGTPDVRTTFTGDLYLSVTNIDPASQTVGLMLLVNPMVGWIWIAVLVMAFGGLIATFPSRRHEEVVTVKGEKFASATSEAPVGISQ